MIVDIQEDKIIITPIKNAKLRITQKRHGLIHIVSVSTISENSIRKKAKQNYV